MDSSWITGDPETGPSRGQIVGNGQGFANRCCTPTLTITLYFPTTRGKSPKEHEGSSVSDNGSPRRNAEFTLGSAENVSKNKNDSVGEGTRRSQGECPQTRPSSRNSQETIGVCDPEFQVSDGCG